MDVEGCDEDPEFDAWGFFPLSVLPTLVVPFRKPVYEKVADAFAKFAAPVIPDARSAIRDRYQSDDPE
jgi:putative (di)nucleoside polyphosphate hydrolase